MKRAHGPLDVFHGRVAGEAEAHAGINDLGRQADGLQDMAASPFPARARRPRGSENTFFFKRVQQDFGRNARE